MNSEQAKQILAAFRPGTDDEHDPYFAEALALTHQDPALARWFKEQQAVDAALKEKFASIEAPLGLKRRLLADRPAARESRWLWNGPLIGLAAAAVVLIAAVWVWMLQRQSPTLEAYRAKMTGLVSGEYKMMLETNNVSAIREYLAANHGHGDFVLSEALEKLPAEGCALIDWKGRKVSLVCLEAGEDHDLFLFVADRGTLTDAPSSPQFGTVGPMATATWSRDNKTYLLAAKGDIDQLRKYL